MTDPLAERLERVDHGVLCSCDTMRTNPHAPSCRLFKVTAEVRAFLAERVTAEKVVAVIKANDCVRMGVKADALGPTSKHGERQYRREADAVLALLRREAGG